MLARRVLRSNRFETSNIWSTQCGSCHEHYESRSGTSASEPTYAARLTDVLIRLYAPIASKPGSKGGTLSQALSSRSTLKQMQENTDQLTWREMMDTCIRFGEENSTPQLVTSMLANPAKDTDSGAPADKGSRRGGSRGSDRKADTGGKGGKGTAYSTTNGTSTGLCLHHCIPGFRVRIVACVE